MANDKIIRLPTQAQATITAAQTGNIELFADDGTDLLGSVDPAGVVTIYGLGSVDESQIIYVGKHGSDANNGKSNAKAKLTFGAAITAAAAESPSSSNPIVIRCEDAGIYTESFSVASWVKIDGEACDIVGNITVEGNTTLTISRLDVSSGVGITKDTDTNHCLVNVGRIACTGTATAVDVVSGVMMIEIDMVTHVNGDAITITSVTASEIRGFINHITSTGTGAAIAMSGNAGHHMSLCIADIRGTGDGVDIDTGTLDFKIAHLDPDTGGDVASGATLNIIVADLNGLSFTGSGTINLTEAGIVAAEDIVAVSEAQGDILYRNATEWVRLAAGTAGQVLQTNGAGANPSWVAATGSNTLRTWTPAANEPPTTNPATFVVRNGHLLLAFDDTTDEIAIFKEIMPQGYSGEDVDVIIRFVMATATTGDVDLDAAFERLDTGGQDIDSDGFATAQSVLGTTVPGTSGVIGAVTIPFTGGAQMDSVVAGDGFRLRIRSLNAGTAVGDLQLLDLELRKQ